MIDDREVCAVCGKWCRKDEMGVRASDEERICDDCWTDDMGVVEMKSVIREAVCGLDHMTTGCDKPGANDYDRFSPEHCEGCPHCLGIVERDD